MARSTAQKERQALAALFEDKGPLAPTLCEGWATSDLAAHLYVREHKPLASPGILVPPLAFLTERAMERAKRELGYGKLIEAIRSGPPFPWSLVDSTANLNEYFVHHEDVRRAAGTFEPRADPELDRALWESLRRGAKLLALRLRGKVGLQVVGVGFGEVQASPGQPLVTIKGAPQELVLFIFGRKSVADVTFDGSDEAVERLKSMKLGF